MAHSIAKSLAEVRAQIADAAVHAGRSPSDVALLAVSKTKPVGAVEEAYHAGQRDFGENYVQELTAKAAALAHLDSIRWHHIGHLQTNKVKAVLPVVHRLHAVDRVSLVDELERRAAAGDRSIEVLVEVNVAGEASKSGCAPEALGTLLAAIEAAPHVRARGLMTMPPLDDDPETTRPHFRALRALRDAHGGYDRLPELSMGMSHDFHVAIAEGATIVRVGTAIFGVR